MITWKEIDDAVGGIVSAALTDADLTAARIRSDISEPIARRSYRIDLTNTDDTRTETYAERGMDVEIYYYPQEKERPRDELNDASQVLKSALGGGILVSDVHIELSEGIEADVSDGILTLMFRLEWIETKEDEGEMMEKLVVDGEEAVNGSNDA